MLLVLFDGEDLLIPKTRGDDADNITGAEGSLLDGTADNLSNSLNVVNVGDGKTYGKLRVTLGGLDEVVKSIKSCVGGKPLQLFLASWPLVCWP